MYKILLQRVSEHKNVKKPNKDKIEDSTLGEFKIIDKDGKIIWQCYTCENIGPSTDTAKQDKRIIARKYNLEWTSSSTNGSLSKNYPKYKTKDGRNKAILLTCDNELPSFRNRRILIHVGNYPQDTEGCLLLGMSKNEKGYISQSVVAVNEFFQLVEKHGIENFILEIKEIENT